MTRSPDPRQHPRDGLADVDQAGDLALLRDLARVKAIFQQRAVVAVLSGGRGLPAGDA